MTYLNLLVYLILEKYNFQYYYYAYGVDGLVYWKEKKAS